MKAAHRASFTTLEGDTIHVSDFKGKVMKVDFWKPGANPVPAVSQLLSS